MTRLAVIIACVAALLAAGCGERSPERATSSPAGAAKGDGLPELTRIGQLQAAFDAHPGVPRLVILLSPT